MRNKARLFRVVMSMSAAFALTAVLEAAGGESALAQEPMDRAIFTSIDVQPSDLTGQPARENWLSYHGDYTGRRFNGLVEITPPHVRQFKAQWVFYAPNVSDFGR